MERFCTYVRGVGHLGSGWEGIAPNFGLAPLGPISDRFRALPEVQRESEISWLNG